MYSGGALDMFDPFSTVDLEERATIDAEMYTIPLGRTVLGIDEGLLVGLIIGWFLAVAFQGD